MSTENTFVNEPDRIIIYDELAEDVINDCTDYSEYPEAMAKLLAEFEPVKPERGSWLADPRESYYQGIEVMVVIRRKADGRLFGFQYWTPVSKHGEAIIEPNGDEHGFDFDPPSGFDWNNGYVPDVYVFLPVEPFTVTGYQIAPELLP